MIPNFETFINEGLNKTSKKLIKIHQDILTKLNMFEQDLLGVYTPKFKDYLAEFKKQTKKLFDDIRFEYSEIIGDLEKDYSVLLNVLFYANLRSNKYLEKKFLTDGYLRGDLVSSMYVNPNNFNDSLKSLNFDDVYKTLLKTFDKTYLKLGIRPKMRDIYLANIGNYDTSKEFVNAFRSELTLSKEDLIQHSDKIFSTFAQNYEYRPFLSYLIHLEYIKVNAKYKKAYTLKANNLLDVNSI